MNHYTIEHAHSFCRRVPYMNDRLLILFPRSAEFMVRVYSAEVYERKGSLLYFEVSLFYVLQHLLLAAERPDERLHGYISAYLPNLDFGNA